MDADTETNHAIMVTDARQNAANFSHYDSPWENTAPRDWSSLSAANTTARVLQAQQRQRELEATYEQGRQQAYQACTYGSNNVSGAYSSLACPSNERQARQSGCYSSTTQLANWSDNVNGAISRYVGIDWSSVSGGTDSLQMVFSNYPSIYGPLYSYLRK